MAVKNMTVLEKAWIEGSNDFQQRIPNPSIAGYDATVNALFDPYNGQFLNEFSNLTVGMMGTYVHSKRFENPLRGLKKPAATWGSTERHVAVKYLKAHSPKVNDETLLKLEAPEFVEWWYSTSQHRRYEFSWSRYELQRVFAQDGYGYDDLLGSTLDAQYSSDAYDEMSIMIEAFAYADKSEHMTLHRTNISAAPTSKETGQELLAKIRTDAGNMQFPTKLYNNLDVPTFERPESLILWVTPGVDAYLDVYALADIFHLDKAEVNYRKVLIPQFPIPNVYAALTSEDFIYCRDIWYGVEPPFYNPSNRTYKYYLFHDQLIGVNPLANCTLYTTDAGTETPTITMKTTGMKFSTATGTVAMGGTLDVGQYLTLTGTVSRGSAIKVEPNAARYSLAATNSAGTSAVKLNTRTYITDAGVLHLQASGLTAGDIVTVTATSSYINPSGTTSTYTATFKATVAAAASEGGKASFVEDNPNLVYTSSGDEVSYTE